MPRLVQFLIARRGDWPSWREHYRRLRQRYQQRAGPNAVAGRMAEHFAAMRMTAILTHMVLDLPWGYQDLVSEHWEELVARTSEADRAAVALRYILSWAESHREEFWGQRSGSEHPPSQGWAGRWDRAAWERRPPDAFIGFLPHKLDQALREGHFEPEPIRLLWLQRGWLRVTPSRNQYRARLGGDNTYVVAITAMAVRQSLGEDEPESRPPPSAPRGVVGGAPERE